MLDRLLAEECFIQVRTMTLSHHTCVDEIYTHPPKITISNLGTKGRFGNQLFQYMFLICYGKETGYTVETPDWIGRYLFDANDPLLTNPSAYSEVRQTKFNLDDCEIANSSEKFPFADFNGFYQYRTNYYAPYKPFIRSSFRPSEKVLQHLAPAQDAFDALEGPVVGVHIRRGDYGYGHFFIAPVEWYLDWLDRFGGGKPVTIFLASDDLDLVRNEFGEHKVVTSTDLGAELPEAPYFPDFHFLTQCSALAISNSSFSFSASMLNEKAEVFLRPDLQHRKLIAFDPWNSEPLLKNAMAEDHGGAFMNVKRRGKMRQRIKRFLGLVPR